MVAICVQCGDVGYDNAFVYCVNCLKFSIHRYCLPEIPKTFDEFVHWVCDDCEAVSLGCPFKKGLLNTQDDRCTEFDIFTSTSGSNKKNISQSSLGEEVSYGRTGSMLQSVHENLCSSGDARLADDCCLSLVEPNASNDWSRNENVPVKDGHQSDTSQQLDGVEEVKVDDLLQIINLGKKAEVSSSLLGKEKLRLPTTSDQKKIDGERQSDTLQHHGEEKAEVVADKLSKRTKFRENNHISSTVSEEKKQRQTTSIHFAIAYQKKFEVDAPSRFIPLHNESQTGNSPRIQGVGMTQVVEGSSQRTKFPVMSQISSCVTQKEKQMRWSTSSNQCRSRQPQQLGNRLLIYPPLRNELKNHRLRSLVNIAKQRYYGRSSRKTHEARRPMHYSVREREKDHAKKESLLIPSRSCVNEEQLTHEARRPMHNTVCEEDGELAKEESSVNLTLSNVNEDVSRKTHEARRHMHNTICERYEDRVEEESLVIPTRSEVIDVDSRCPIMPLPIARPSGYCLQVQPVVDPIWRGRFDIVNKKDEKFEGFVAHLSNTACQQVIEEARLLPTFLQLEMVPKSTVWPKSFQTGEPSNDNIALYIFPADTRYEKIFARLVDDMSRHELAMKAITKNAELLIFTSKELKLQYWRFQNKYYIWGVFKGKRS